ncbi:TniB family NTP-binding protein [Lysobacter sp.]|uniref:TniB family NTP-binding protein n=1 Tax=Lysobacter sp. TaxID=72226 RepID=UPI002D4EDC67|nr:TniB family NTP-binding protein [Lysobacter sp.]HZX77385.1 TniB family NTP-binding protein [Lysobacter sp.]
MSKHTDLTQFKNLVGAIRIDHRAYDAIHQALSETYDDVDSDAGVDGEPAVPACLLLIGETRTGKSSVVKDFLARNPPKRRKDGMRQAVIYAAAPPEGTVKALLEQLLKALGDPLWSKGSRTNMTHRLLTLLKGVGCRMIILDEFQHLVDKGQKKRLFESADWLKNLVESREWALVAVGLPDSVSVVNANPQLKARFDAPLTMPLFNWQDDHSRRQFKAVLKAFAMELQPFELPALESDEIALRLYLATSGRLGLFAKLMDRAVKTAIRHNTTAIRLDDLAAAFDRAIWYAPTFPLEDGPFGANLDLCRQDEILDQVRALAQQDAYADTSGAVSITASPTARPAGTGRKGRGTKRELRDQMARAL